MSDSALTVIVRPEEMRAQADLWRSQGLTIALVPTMGFLHEGHASLIRRARELADRVVVSIFVNPIQFGPNEDFAAYPRDLEKDKALVTREGTDLLFVPEAADLYPSGFQTSVHVERLTAGLCGASRPGHFDGVTTVVTLLFHLAKPHIAVFGAKDYQQAAVVRRMTRDLCFGIAIEVAPIVRESSGLAMSSRNSYLSAQQRAEATVLYHALRLAEALVRSGERDAGQIIAAMRILIDGIASSRIDYIALVDPDTLEPVQHIVADVQALLAVYIGRTRLIDNMRLAVKND
ncbi:MAG TPA: pantoate--beta-alanine ligase [bacterium]|nr:pantoate--beta-alanine ligase [bacterium]HQG44499.1 pantoate--beta-alanine ligase [bacterium]HQI47794.1 pantoate--beta-alanine ligase [bacterium]HQJ65417.1 pantoate--beta-alanine ligase [bacterium]